MDKTKKCTKCGEIKELDNFHRDVQKVDNLRSWCKQCVNKNDAQYRKNHNEKILIRHRQYYQKNKDVICLKNNEYRRNNIDKVGLRDTNRHLLKKYGITIQQKLEMVNIQGGKCGICGTDLESGRNTHVDHNHITGSIRGVLCNKCNLHLGWLEKPGFMKVVMDYINKYQEEKWVLH